MGVTWGTTIGDIKGDTRSLDYVWLMFPKIRGLFVGVPLVRVCCSIVAYVRMNPCCCKCPHEAHVSAGLILWREKRAIAGYEITFSYRKSKHLV